MPSMFDQAFELSAAPQIDSWFGGAVQLQQGSSTSAEFDAAWSSQEYRSLEHETGLSIVVRRRVYRFLKTDAVIASAEVTPKAGDYLIDGDDSMLICPIDGKPAVEDEPGGYRWLVRTDKMA